MPYRTLDDRIDGVVITFADITAAKTLEAKLRAKQAGLEKTRRGASRKDGAGGEVSETRTSGLITMGTSQLTRHVSTAPTQPDLRHRGSAAEMRKGQHRSARGEASGLHRFPQQRV